MRVRGNPSTNVKASPGRTATTRVQMGSGQSLVISRHTCMAKLAALEEHPRQWLGAQSCAEPPGAP